jgi:hypothetical protein
MGWTYRSRGHREMKLSDEAWSSHWSKEQFPPACSSYACGFEFGTPNEPASSLWCASLLEPLRKAGALSTEFAAVDWGCGDGRLFNFLSRRYRKFRYFGIEQENSFGMSCLWRASASFGQDKRAMFATAENNKAAQALDKATFIVLGSVATHLVEQDLRECLSKFDRALRRGAPLVSSFFIGNSFSAFIPGLYGNPKCHGAVTYTKPMIEDIAKSLGCTATEEGEFEAKDGHLHRIVVFRKA